MSNNRKPVTIRLNLQEQGNLRSLCEFYSLDERSVVKLGFEQLAQATNQLQLKLKNEGKLEEPTQLPSGVHAGSGTSDGPVGADTGSGNENAGSGDGTTTPAA